MWWKGNKIRRKKKIMPNITDNNSQMRSLRFLISFSFLQRWEEERRKRKEKGVVFDAHIVYGYGYDLEKFSMSMSTQMQDQPSNPTPNPISNSTFIPNPITPHNNAAPPHPQTTSSMFENMRSGGTQHRRAHSEVSFRLPEDMADPSPSDPFNGAGAGAGGGGGGSSTASLEEMGSEDDLFSTYIDVEKLGTDQSGGEGNAGGGGERGGNRARHRHSSSVDGSSTTTSSTSVFGEIMEAKKAMPPDKLAELWTLDPKRAKRFHFLSNYYLKALNLESEKWNVGVESNLSCLIKVKSLFRSNSWEF